MGLFRNKHFWRGFCAGPAITTLIVLLLRYLIGE